MEAMEAAPNASEEINASGINGRKGVAFSVQPKRGMVELGSPPYESGDKSLVTEKGRLAVTT